MAQRDAETEQQGAAIPPGPLGGHHAAIVHGLLIRFGLTRLSERYDPTLVLSVFNFINGCLSIGLMATVALISGQPFVFPSLGPTAFLFFYTPLAASASPRNAICGHLIGSIAGFTSLVLFGLRDAGPAIATGVDGPRVAAAALSLGLTSGLMILLKVPHPPAGATTLIISLGVMSSIEQIAVLMAAVVLLTLQAMAINRLAGLPYPLWAPLPAESLQSAKGG
jgi:CBS-domain-containing membrane protein